MVQKLLFRKTNLKIFTKLTCVFLIVSFFQLFKAQIVYKDIIPDFTITMYSNGGAYNDIIPIDFNSDGTKEYDFRWEDWGPPGNEWFMHMTFGGPNNQMALKGTAVTAFGGKILVPLQANQTIDASLTWGNSYPEPFVGESTTDANFRGLGDRYIGVRFKIGTNTYYGWVLVNFSNTRVLTVKSYAYNSTPNQSILAGQKTLLGTNEVQESKNESLIFPNPATSEVTLPEKSSFVTFYDVSGKKIMDAHVGDHKKVNISTLEDGTYILSIKTKDKKTVSAKLIKNSNP